MTDVTPQSCSCTEPCRLARMGLAGDPGCRGLEAFPDWNPDSDTTGYLAENQPPVEYHTFAGAKQAVAYIGGAFAVIFMIVAVVLSWPAHLGGQFTLAGVSGNSMEPGLHTGDLVVARHSDSYEVGDVVVYDAVEGGQVQGRVIHRVVRVLDDGTYLTKGDNNAFNDPWHVRQEWILGEEVLLVPNGAIIPTLFRSPIVLGSLTALLIMFLLWPARRPGEAESADPGDHGAETGPDDPESPGDPADPARTSDPVGIEADASS